MFIRAARLTQCNPVTGTPARRASSFIITGQLWRSYGVPDYRCMYVCTYRYSKCTCPMPMDHVAMWFCAEFAPPLSAKCASLRRRAPMHPASSHNITEPPSNASMMRKLNSAVQALSKSCHWLVATRTRRRWVIRIAIIAILCPLFLQWFLAYIVGSDARLLPPELLTAKNLLVVTAHPDDECLFFSPSILGVLDRNKNIKGGLVVMSTGTSCGTSLHCKP